SDLKENAKREAQLVLEAAERQRRERLLGVEEGMHRARADLSRLERERALFKEQFRGLLLAYLRTLDADDGVAAPRRQPDAADAARRPAPPVPPAGPAAHAQPAPAQPSPAQAARAPQAHRSAAAPEAQRAEAERPRRQAEAAADALLDDSVQP